MITKTLFGIDFFDAHYGGVYRGRPVLLSGRKGLGKTTIAMQFLCKGLQQDETCLMLNTLPNYNLDIYADMLGFSLANHVNDGRLILLESSNFSGVCGTKMLPPECFEQLRQIIDTHMIQRMVIDTIVPLVAVNPPERINEHIYSFMRSFDRLGVTTLMTLPKPVSPMAVRLKNALEAALPISILLNSTDDPSTYTFQVVKYMGAPKLAAPVNYKFKTGAGVVSCASLYAESVQPPAQAVSGPPPAETKSSVSAPSESPPAETKPAVPAQTWFPLVQAASRLASADAPRAEAASRPTPAEAPRAEAASRLTPAEAPRAEAASRPTPAGSSPTALSSAPVTSGLRMSSVSVPTLLYDDSGNGRNGRNGRNKVIEETKPMPKDAEKPPALPPSNGKLRLSNYTPKKMPLDRKDEG